MGLFDDLLEDDSELDSQSGINNINQLNNFSQKKRVGLFDDLLEEEVGTLQGIANSAQNAFDSSKQALLAVGGVDQDQAEQISKLEYAKQARKTAPGYAEYQKAEGMDAVGAFLKNPVEVTTNIIGEGLAGSLPALGAGVATGVAGAAVGSVAFGLGAGIGYTAGQVAGTFGGSLSTEYGSKILEELQSSGMDITDPNSIQSYFSDEEKLAPIREKALKRGVPIAAFDAVSAGIGGKLGRVFGSEIIKEGEKVLGKKFATKTGEALTELGAQAVLGGGGSVAGSVAIGEEVDLKDVFAEVIGEVGTGSIEVLQGKIADRANQRKLIEAKANQDILNLSETLERNNAPQTARATTQELAKQLSDDLNVDREKEAVELADLGGQTLKKINEVKAETQTATTKEEVAANLSEEDLNTREQDAKKLVQQYKDAYFESQDPNDRAKAVEFQGVLDAIQVEKRKRSYEKGRSAPTQQQDVTTPTAEEVVTPTTGTEVIPLRDAIIQSGIPEEAADIYINNLKSEGINEDQIREIADNNKSLREEAARKNEEESIAKRDLAQRARMGDKEARAQLEGERGILATPTTEDITAVPPVAEAATLPVEQAPLTQQAVAQQIETQPYATQEIIQPEGIRQEPQDGTQIQPTTETGISDSILGTERSQEEGQVIPTSTAEQETLLGEAKSRYDSEIATYKNQRKLNLINDQELGKKLKAAGMQFSAEKRKVTGQLTDKEFEAEAKRKASNYIGKPVEVDGKLGKVIGNPFGRVKVKLDDGGTIITTTSNKVTDRLVTESTQTQAPSQISNQLPAPVTEQAAPAEAPAPEVAPIQQGGGIDEVLRRAENAATREEAGQIGRDFAALDPSLPPTPSSEYETVKAISDKAGRRPYNADALTEGNITAAKEAGLVTKTKAPKLTESGRNLVTDGVRVARDREMAIGDITDRITDQTVSAWDAKNDPTSAAFKARIASQPTPAVSETITPATQAGLQVGRSGTEEQIKSADQHAVNMGGSVLYQDGDISLIRGYSLLNGSPVYIVSNKEMRARNDISSYAGNLVTTEQKAQLIDLKNKIESKDQESFNNNPFITFSDGISFSNEVPESIAGILKGWKSLLNIKANVYVTTYNDVLLNRDKFNGPHRVIGSSTLNSNKTSGSIQRMPNGDFYIMFRTNPSNATPRQQAISHTRTDGAVIAFIVVNVVL